MPTRRGRRYPPLTRRWRSTHGRRAGRRFPFRGVRQRSPPCWPRCGRRTRFAPFPLIRRSFDESTPANASRFLGTRLPSTLHRVGPARATAAARHLDGLADPRFAGVIARQFARQEVKSRSAATAATNCSQATIRFALRRNLVRSLRAGVVASWRISGTGGSAAGVRRQPAMVVQVQRSAGPDP